MNKESMTELEKPPQLPLGQAEADWPYFAAVVAAVLLMCAALFRFDVPSGHDAFCYPTRLAEVLFSASNGHFFSQWAPHLNFGYGSPIFSFQSPLIYYIAAPFHMAGAGLGASLNMAAVLIMLAAASGMYLFMRGMAGKRGACLAAVAYVTAPYLLCDLYSRAAFSEYTAFASMPFIFWSLDRLLDERPQVVPFLAGVASVAALMLSHNFIALITVPAACGYVLFRALWEGKWRGAVLGALAMGFGAGLTAFFWLPAMRDTVFVKIGRLTGSNLKYYYSFLSVKQLFVSIWPEPWKFPGPVLGIPHVAGAVLAAVFAACRPQRLGSRNAIFWFLLCLAAAATYMITRDSWFIWQKVPLLQFGQFPWRFLSLSSFVFAACLGFLGPWLDGLNPRLRRPVFYGALGALLAAGLLFAHPAEYMKISDPAYSPEGIIASGATTTYRNEFEPLFVRESPSAPPAQRVEIVSGQAKLIVLSTDPLDYAIGVAAETDATIRLNVFYYPAWKASLDGRPVVPDFSNKHGAMDFAVGPGKHELRVTFRRTEAGLFGLRISQASLLALAALGTVLIVRRRRRHQG